MFVFCFFCFFFNDTATTEIYTLSLHDALPISVASSLNRRSGVFLVGHVHELQELDRQRSEEHTSELQSRGHLVCRLLLEKKKKLHILSICTATRSRGPQITTHPSSLTYLPAIP